MHFDGFMHVSLFGNRPRAGSMRWPKDRNLESLFDGSLSAVPDLLTNYFVQLQYPSLPWVRYITQSGDIAVRLPDVQ